MSWLDTIKGYVVDEDPKPTAQPAQAQANIPDGVYSLPVSLPAAQYSTQGLSGQTIVPPGSFLAKLRSKLSTPGSAAEKFETTFNSLSAIADAGVRLTSTLSVLKNTAGIETQALLQEYSVRRQRLDQEVQSFAQAIAGQRKTEVDDKQASITAVDAQIQQLSMQRANLTSTMSAAKAKLEQSQAGFDAAVTAVRGEIEGALSRLKGAHDQI